VPGVAREILETLKFFFRISKKYFRICLAFATPRGDQGFPQL